MKSSRAYQICNRCIMDTSDFQISFNSDGYCNYCITAFERLKYLDRITDEQNIIEGILKEIRKYPSKEGYHALIGVSGGIDSSYLLHVLSKQDVKLLAVHVDAGWNSIEAVRNINSMVSTLNIDLETIVIDWEEMKALQIAYLKSGVINQDVPQDHAFFSSLYKLARKLNIRHVISGSNYATESILPQSWGQSAMDGKQLIQIFKKFTGEELEKYPVIFLRNLYWNSYFMNKYKVITPLNYLKYSKKIATELLETYYGWKDYGGKHKESRFTEYFQEVYLPERFSIQKKRAHYSSLIVNGELGREEAIEKLSLSKINELDRSNLERFIATKLGISIQELRDYAKLPFVNDRIYHNEAYLTALISKSARFRKTLSKVINFKKYRLLILKRFVRK
jgi:N-acetyl sugar amidotransferase